MAHAFLSVGSCLSEGVWLVRFVPPHRSRVRVWVRPGFTVSGGFRIGLGVRSELGVELRVEVWATFSPDGS